MTQTTIVHFKEKSLGYYFIKRLFDIVFSLLFFFITLPLFVIVSLLIVTTSKGHAFYISERVGKDSVIFKMIKFRTMIRGAEKKFDELKKYNEMSGPVFKMEADPRITKVGKILRLTSIDELPQLINIFLGQMSFVGPRPALKREVDEYDDFARLRLTVKPGLTCIWQCSGRNNIDFDKWMKLDIEYIQKRSFLFDLLIILKTIPAVITQKGAQ